MTKLCVEMQKLSKKFGGCHIFDYLCRGKKRKTMRNNIFVIILTAALALAPCVTSMASENDLQAAALAADESKPAIVVGQNCVTIVGAAGKTMEVVSLTGKPMMTITIESQSQRVELNFPRGCYIVKVGNVVRKVSVA